VRAWVLYSLIRVGIIIAVFALLVALGIQWWLAAIVAAVIALCISYIFLGKLRGQVAADIAERRASAGQPPAASSDEGVEDALDEASGPEGADAADADASERERRAES
jgi:hypothetical protein